MGVIDIFKISQMSIDLVRGKLHFM